MSLFLSGICMKHYAWYNLSEYGQVTTDQFFKMLAFLSETFVFVYVGMNVFGYTSELKWDPLLIFWATVGKNNNLNKIKGVYFYCSSVQYCSNVSFGQY